MVDRWRLGVALAGALWAACGGSGGGPGDPDAGFDGGAIDAAHVPGTPRAGAHALAYFRLESHATPLRTAPMATAANGSTLVVSVGRGNASTFVAPDDSYQNGAYPQLGIVHRYTNWSGSGTALYARTGAAGGPGHTLAVMTPSDDEVTMAGVEVLDGTRVAAYEWNEVLAPAPLRSRSVTTTGPATLIAFWWGDADVQGQKTAVPDSGFTVVDAILDEGALVQCAVAVKDVATAGTYDVTWTATPVQGAQMWLVAVE